MGHGKSGIAAWDVRPRFLAGQGGIFEVLGRSMRLLGELVKPVGTNNDDQGLRMVLRGSRKDEKG